MFENVKGSKRFRKEVLAKLERMVKYHMSAWSAWLNGKPTEIFKRDGAICVRYESGAWWHYPCMGEWY